jgi:hypothetical protein
VTRKAITYEGAGKDVSSAGHAITDEANKDKKWCCQSNANSSPEGAHFVNVMRVYTASIRHSAGAAERPCL